MRQRGTDVHSGPAFLEHKELARTLGLMFRDDVGERCIVPIFAAWRVFGRLPLLRGRRSRVLYYFLHSTCLIFIMYV